MMKTYEVTGKGEPLDMPHHTRKHVMGSEPLTQESIELARKWFAENALACIEEVKSGNVKVNDPEKYFASCKQRAEDAIAGKGDHTFTFRQRAYYIQTGKCEPLMADGHVEEENISRPRG
jgi:hypothetical protein